MITLKGSCVKCGGEYTIERGQGAKPINASHLCDACISGAVKQHKADVKAEKAEIKAETKREEVRVKEAEAEAKSEAKAEKAEAREQAKHSFKK